MDHSQKNVSQSEKNGSQLKTCDRVGEMNTFREMCHSQKRGHSWKNVSPLEKCVTFRKMFHSLKNMLQLEK